MEDKIVKTNVFERDMSVVLPDGKKVPVRGEVTETHYESGRKDVHVNVKEAIKFDNTQKAPQVGTVISANHSDGSKDTTVQL
jgi:hypothetical protein